MTNFSFQFAFFLNCFRHFFEHFDISEKTLMKLRTRYDAIECIPILDNIKQCDL